MKSSKLDFIAKILSNSNGKDKVIRLISYAAMVIGSSRMASKSLKSSLSIIASQMSYARVLTRLLDDIPMLKYNLDCLKSSSGNKFEDLLICTINLVDQLYYPVEHLVSRHEM